MTPYEWQPGDPWHTGDPCPNCGNETDTDKCGPLYCGRCNWQVIPCEHQEPMLDLCVGQAIH